LFGLLVVIQEGMAFPVLLQEEKIGILCFLKKCVPDRVPFFSIGLTSGMLVSSFLLQFRIFVAANLYICAVY